MQNKCLTNSLVYLSTISTIENPTVEKFYIVSTKNSFKTRWYQHILSFTNSTYKNRISLSEYFWNLKEVNNTLTVKWKVLKKARTCKSLNEPCFLCLHKKLEIIRFADKNY